MLEGKTFGPAAGIAATILVIGLVGLIVLGGGELSSQHQVLGTPTFTPTATPTFTPTATPTYTPTPTPTATFTPSPTPTPIWTPTITPTPSRTPTPTPAPASAHLWLEKPIAPDAEGDRYPGTWFPYGATGGGRYHLHHGVDYMNPEGTLILAAAAGTVVVSGDDLETVYGKKTDFYGNLVIQELDRQFQGQPVYVLYGHMLQSLVEVGQHLEVGDPIGLVGMTGVAIGNHLHMEVRLGTNEYASSRNPVLWLQPDPGQGIIAGLVLDAGGQPASEVPVSFFRAAEPTKWWTQTQTYGNTDKEIEVPILVNSDDQLGENFGLGNVPAGDYLVQVKIGDRTYVAPVTVEAGQIAFVEIAAEE